MKIAIELKQQVRAILIFFIIALIVSGVTAIPVDMELQFIVKHLASQSSLRNLLSVVLQGVQETKQNCPFLFYGFDWLAFAHFVIAISFLGPLKDPVKNIWVIEFGMIASALIIPFALIAGGIRGLPLWWRLIDCSFGLFGIIPLWICRIKIIELGKILKEERLNIIF